VFPSNHWCHCYLATGSVIAASALYAFRLRKLRVNSSLVTDVLVEFAAPIVGAIQQELIFLNAEEIKSCVMSGTIYQSGRRDISQKTFIYVADDVLTKTLMDIIC
jgi:hypothetical protein